MLDRTFLSKHRNWPMRLYTYVNRQSASSEDCLSHVIFSICRVASDGIDLSSMCTDWRTEIEISLITILQLLRNFPSHSELVHPMSSTILFLVNPPLLPYTTMYRSMNIGQINDMSSDTPLCEHYKVGSRSLFSNKHPTSFDKLPRLAIPIQQISCWQSPESTACGVQPQ